MLYRFLKVRKSLPPFLVKLCGQPSYHSPPKPAAHKNPNHRKFLRQELALCTFWLWNATGLVMEQDREFIDLLTCDAPQCHSGKHS